MNAAEPDRKEAPPADWAALSDADLFVLALEAMASRNALSLHAATLQIRAGTLGLVGEFLLGVSVGAALTGWLAPWPWIAPPALALAAYPLFRHFRLMGRILSLWRAVAALPEMSALKALETRIKGRVQ